VSVSWGGGRAFYDRRADTVQMPDRAAFFEDAGLATVLLHEAAHWTGHPTRLAREFGQRFGDQAYAFEELVAELAAAFLCADFGVSNEPRLDHAQYVASWLDVLGKDQRAIFNAAKLATEAAHFFTKGAQKFGGGADRGIGEMGHGFAGAMGSSDHRAATAGPTHPLGRQAVAGQRWSRNRGARSAQVG
jgi:antirestriction protein ArdC